jgi:hypothetical protein
MREANAYKEYPGENHVWYVEEDTLGWILEVCCDRYGRKWVTVYWPCIDEIWTVSADDIAGGQICYR